jgi:hypothetical protein
VREIQVSEDGLVLNALVLFNTRYLDAALAQLRASGDEDVAKLSPFRHRHINMLGHYLFFLPAEFASGLRTLRDPDSIDDEELD